MLLGATLLKPVVALSLLAFAGSAALRVDGCSFETIHTADVSVL